MARCDRWLIAAFVVSAAAMVLPIWIVKYLPLLDLPNHLTAVAVWHYHDDPEWDFARFYKLNLVPLPYWAHYYTVHLLTYVTRSVEVANKIFLTAYALALPAGALALARRFGRSPWLALFVFPLVWNFNLGRRLHRLLRRPGGGAAGAGPRRSPLRPRRRGRARSPSSPSAR